MNDGVNIRLMSIEKVSRNYQILIELIDRIAIVFTAAMYGVILFHNGFMITDIM